MKLKFSSLTAAIALLAATSAMANPVSGNAGSNGNSSMSFVAINGAGDSSLTVDLAIDFASFVSAAANFKTTNGTLSSGANPTGITATWNFSTNTFAVNNVSQAGSYAWSTTSSTFLTAAAGDYRWGVIGADAVSGNLSATNIVFGQNILYTGLSNDFDNSNDSGINGAAIADAAGRTNTFLAATLGKGTHTASVRGANIAASGDQFLGTTLTASGNGDYSVQFGTNNWLVNPTDVSKFYLTNAGGGQIGPRTFAIGNPDVIGAESGSAATWTWDEANTTLTYTLAAPVPEPGTYAMLLAGLVGVGFMARRRRGA